MAEKIRTNEKSVFMLYSSVMVSRIDPEFWVADRGISSGLLQMLLVACLHASAFEAMEKHDADSRQTVQLWDLTKRHSVPLDKELSRVANAMVYGPETNVQHPWKMFLRVLPLYQKRSSFPAAKSSQNPQEVHLDQIKWARHEAKAFLKEFGGASPIHLALLEAVFDEPKMAGYLRSSAARSRLLQPVYTPEEQERLAQIQRQQQKWDYPPHEGRLSYYSPLVGPRQTFRTRSEQLSPVELRSSAPLNRTYSSKTVPTLQDQRNLSGDQSEFIAQ